MITLLSRIFIPKEKENDYFYVRKAYGMICSVFGIFLNMLLFALKLVVGILTSSVAIMADAFNNLSDAGSSVITLIGVVCAGRRADREHPFGHGRVEYVSGFIVSLVILLVGFEFLKDSIFKIFHPDELFVTAGSLLVLCASILIKIYMACYNHAIGKRLDSSVMKATAMDSLSDALSTFVVLVSSVVMKLTGKNLDGAAGIFVALFILWTGYQAARETMTLLLGRKPNHEIVEKIRNIVMSHENVLGIHHIIVHDYGPERKMISLHLEMPGEKNVFEMHDLIEHIEADLDRELSCESVIHMDPVETGNEELTKLRRGTEELIETLGEELSIHDFRVVRIEDEKDHILFDVVVPFDFSLTKEELREKIIEEMEKRYPDYVCVIKLDQDYI